MRNILILDRHFYDNLHGSHFDPWFISHLDFLFILEPNNTYTALKNRNTGKSGPFTEAEMLKQIEFTK